MDRDVDAARLSLRRPSRSGSRGIYDSVDRRAAVREPEPDAEDEYFSDGLADELLNVLAKIRGLRVAARTSSFQFKGKKDDIATIGQKLNVATMLEGSVRKAGNRMRISVQLVKVIDG